MPRAASGARILIAVMGVIGVIAAVLLELAIVQHHSTSTVTKRGSVTTTVTGPSAPAPALVTACLAAGLVLILTAIFFTRISKVAITGVGEIDLTAAAKLAGKVAAKAGGDPDKATALYKTAATHAAALAASQPTIRARIAQIAAGSPSTVLTDDTLQHLVDTADTAYHAPDLSPPAPSAGALPPAVG